MILSVQSFIPPVCLGWRRKKQSNCYSQSQQQDMNHSSLKIRRRTALFSREVPTCDGHLSFPLSHHDVYCRWRSIPAVLDDSLTQTVMIEE